MSFEGILYQVFQPYFYYSIIFLAISFICIKILTRYFNLIGKKEKSLLNLIPLTTPLLVMLIFVPSAVIGIVNQGDQGALSSVTTLRAIDLRSILPIGLIPPVISVTGILCIIGLVAGAFFALSMIVADDRISRRVLCVILMEPYEHRWLQTKVKELSKELSIATPKIGLVEELQPNAFTVGHGKSTTVVFSFGLLNSLSREEITAVAAHELAHVKNHDFYYKIATSALTAVSFFNPLAYLASSSGQREREMLADEGAIQLLEKPEVLGDALAKISKIVQNLPKESVRTGFSSSLLISSSVLRRVGILSTHPRLDKRLRNISPSKPKVHLNARNAGLVFCLSLLLVFSAVAVSLTVVNLQNNFNASHQGKAIASNYLQASLSNSTSLNEPSIPVSVYGTSINPDSSINNSSVGAIKNP